MTKIEWTDATWNPVTGCTPIATGCKHCYARTMHKRLRAMGQPKYQHDFSEVRCHYDDVDKPLHWRKPRMVFVNSMSDIGHPDISAPFVAQIFGTMAASHAWGLGHTYQLLTKRPDHLLELLTTKAFHHDVASNAANKTDSANADNVYDSIMFGSWPLPNVWIGASASNQGDLELVVPPLMEIQAAVRFLSLEPLIGPMVFRMQALRADWVIVGAESGPKRRPCDTQWIESIARQCSSANTPLFVKQAHEGGHVVKMPRIFGRKWAQMPASFAREK